MRPTFETPRDLQIEAEVADLLAKRSGMKAVKTKQYYPVDWVFMRGELAWGVVEIKVRKKHYPQMMLGLEKVQALRGFAADGLEARVVFCTPEGVFVKKIREGPVDGWIGIGGRKDRGDDQDIEPMVFFGPFVVGGVVYKEEAEPMERIADSRPEWFEEG